MSRRQANNTSSSGQSLGSLALKALRLIGLAILKNAPGSTSGNMPQPQSYHVMEPTSQDTLPESVKSVLEAIKTNQEMIRSKYGDKVANEMAAADAAALDEKLQRMLNDSANGANDIAKGLGK
jgi:hypothetical protein